MSKIGIIGAMELEVEQLKAEMSVSKIEKRAGMDFFQGTLNGTPVVVVRSGIGKVNAALCVQILADIFDVTVFGYQPGEVPQLGFREFVADERMATLAKAACEKVNPDIHAVLGRVVSGDQFISGKDVKERLISQFQGDCAEMEGASIAHGACLNKLPFVIIRAISDKADDSAEMDYPVFEREAAKHSAALVTELVKNI